MTAAQLQQWNIPLIHKTMPKNVKVVVCEIDRMSGDVAHNPVSELCQTRNESR